MTLACSFMAGNVNEWTQDVYRPMTEADADDLNSYRGNVFMKPDFDGGLDSMGRVKYVREDDGDLSNRRNYRKSYAIDYNDGDSSSQIGISIRSFYINKQ